jgi:hypothetical protein
MAQMLSWAVTSERMAGRYPPLVVAAHRNYSGRVCAEQELMATKAALGVNDLGAPIVLMVTVALISLALTRFGSMVEVREQRLTKRPTPFT